MCPCWEACALTLAGTCNGSPTTGSFLLSLETLASIRTPKLTEVYSLTCKRRKLKCDETKPRCRKCIKASRDCSYGEQSIFRGQGVSSTPDRIRKGTRDGREKQANGPTEETIWVDLPAECTLQLQMQVYLLTPNSHVC